MENQSAGVGFFNINLLYWEKVKMGKEKINLLELLLAIEWANYEWDLRATPTDWFFSFPFLIL